MNLNYTINNGLQIAGVTTASSIIYDNDQITDSPEVYFLWLKANRKELKIVGNIATKDGHPMGQSLDETFASWNKVYKAFTDTGLKNVPSPVRGATRYFNASSVENSVGADLIISEAKKCSPSNPLVIIVGGQCSTVANALAKDKSIGPNLLVMHVDGKGQTQYNDIDAASSSFLMDNGVSVINWSGDLYGWYNGAGYTGWANAGGKPINRMPGITFGPLNNPFINLYKGAFANVYDAYGSTGDAPPAAYMADHSLWQNVVRKTKANQTVTGAYDYLLISQNKWADYGPILSNFINNPQSYIPVDTQPPVNNPPTISILTSSTTYPAGSSIIITATASDDKAVSKVEFFNGSIKLGESLNSPYSWVINNATAGTYNLTGKATDNEGASTVSEVRVVTVTGVVIPPDPGQRVFDITKAPFFAKGDGLVDDGPAIQAAIDATIQASGKLYIPSAPNFYKHTQTLFIKPKDAQAYISIEGNGRYWGQLVYHGPSGQPAVVIEGLKGGSSILGLHSKIGDGIQDSAAFDIGTNNVSGSTSGFSLRNCTAELNRGVNNVGIRVGLREGPGADISQVVFDNVTCWGPFAIIKGQKGYHFAGANSFLFTLLGGGTVFCETGISVTAGGCITAVGYGTSQNDTELHLAHSTQISFTGGRFESSKRFLRVEQSANFPGVSLRDMVISDFKPFEGKLFDFQAPGGLMLDNVKIENSYDYDGRMFTLGNNGGTLSIRGGAFNASDPFVTQGGWRAKIENVVKLNRDYQSVGYFTNK